MAIDARAFGPSQETRDAQTAIKAAGTVNKAAGAFGAGVPYAGLGLGLASLFTDPTPEGAAKFVGSTITDPTLATAAGNYLSQFAPEGAALASQAAPAAAGATSGLASSLASAGSGLAFSAFAGGGPFKLVLPEGEPSERVQKRAFRTRDAQGLTGETLRGLAAGDLDAPVGGSNVGNTLASILHNLQSGTWYADTSHNALPDLALEPMRRALAGRGYTPTEPTRGDVGGVGEMVAGGGNFFPEDPRVQGGRFTEDGTPIDDLRAGSQGGPYAWNRLMRQIAGVPEDTPRPFETSTGYGDLQLSGNRLQATGQAPTPFDWARFGDITDDTRAELQPEADRQDTAAAYMSGLQSLLPDAYDKVLASRRARDEDAFFRSNMGSP
jgi:hypothetical protein